MKHHQKIEPTHHRSLCNLLFCVWIKCKLAYKYLNNKNVTFQDKPKCLEKFKGSAHTHREMAML